MAILDWMMPGLDGVELCRRIRSHQPGPYKYVLLLTAKGSKEDVVAGLEAGADDYLIKPFNLNELRARVRAGKRVLQLQDALLKVQTELQFESAHDHLTGLWNRGAIPWPVAPGNPAQRENTRALRGDDGGPRPLQTNQ
jgi:two-component system cell cycle response regulator